MGQSGNGKQFFVGSTGCPFKVLRNSSLKFLRFSFDPPLEDVRADFLRGRRPSVKMALRVGGGTRSATFENQSVFFRKVPTVLDFPASRGLRSPRPPPRRALQSPVCIRKKAAANKKRKEKCKNLRKKIKT